MKCFYCGNDHEYKCPMVAAYDFYPDGKISRVEFVTVFDLMDQPANPLTSVPPGTTRQ